jgi:hypothetical protein
VLHGAKPVGYAIDAAVADERDAIVGERVAARGAARFMF